MKIVKPSIEIIDPLDGDAILKKIELCGRTAYKSEDKITETSAAEFVRRLIRRGHESVLEHVSFSVRFICDRGVSHELVRHRHASYTQESTRYCRYEDGITVVEPFSREENTKAYRAWEAVVRAAEDGYWVILHVSGKPESARAVLPTCLKTEVVMTANLREWRHFLRLRTSEAAHPQMRLLAEMLQEELARLVPVVFGLDAQ